MLGSAIPELRERGFVYQITETGLEEAAAQSPLTVYVGFDPTAPSLHLGHVIPLLALSYLQKHGHKVIALVGGGTGLIGDPSGKSTERTLLSEEVIAENAEALKKQLGNFLDFEGDNPAILVNNADWINNTNLVQFLRDIGKHFTVNAMLAKDSVKARLEERSQGISFTEFSYMILQSMDYLELHNRYGCNMQMGGSDQWGNITAGIDLIRRLTSASCHGLTCPLLTRSDGSKFGKTEGGAVWLDAQMTTPYDLYQYWLNVDDHDVIRFLKIFTFLDLDEIEALEEEVRDNPEQRQAQRILAEQFTSLVHGAEIAEECKRASQFLFGGSIDALKPSTIAFLRTILPSASLPREQLAGGISVFRALMDTGLVSSKGEAKRLIKDGGAYLNDERITSAQTIGETDLLHDQGVFLRVGKKKYGLLVVE
jgi:tyrosyl-tRNA synthetase